MVAVVIRFSFRLFRPTVAAVADNQVCKVKAIARSKPIGGNSNNFKINLVKRLDQNLVLTSMNERLFYEYKQSVQRKIIRYSESFGVFRNKASYPPKNLLYIW